MQVKEIAALAAECLGRDDLAAQARAASGEARGELASLLRCYNLVENEIALDYVPLRSEERLSVIGGEVALSRFRFSPVELKRVAGEDGQPIACELLHDRLKVRDCESFVTVLYSYSPPQKQLGEESAYAGKISPRLMAQGIASEFCLTHGQFSEAAMWEKRYRESLRAAQIVRRSISVRSRRWI